MEFNKKELIDQIKMELLVIERGGYQPLVHTPHVQPCYFVDAVGCLNFGLQWKQEPCRNCPWIAFVPPEHREKEDPCQYIRLNEAGDTIRSLEASGLHDKVEKLLLSWLRLTLGRLESSQVPRDR